MAEVVPEVVGMAAGSISVAEVVPEVAGMVTGVVGAMITWVDDLSLSLASPV